MKVFVALCALLALTATEAIPNGEICQLCELVAAEVESALQNQATVSEIENTVKNLCESLPASLSTECTTLATQYLPVVINILKEELKNSSEVCQQLSLCSAASKRSLQMQLRKVSKPDASAECIICEFAMNKLDSILEKNATRQEIEEGLLKVCSFLPTTVRSDCDSFVTTYAQEILSILSQEMNPQMVCTLLKLCQSSNSVVAIAERLAVSKGTCEVCELVFSKLDSILARKGSQAEVMQGLEHVCSLLPSSMSSRCNLIVKDYAGLAIDLVKVLTPAQICARLGLCAGR